MATSDILKGVKDCFMKLLLNKSYGSLKEHFLSAYIFAAFYHKAIWQQRVFRSIVYSNSRRCNYYIIWICKAIICNVKQITLKAHARLACVQTQGFSNIS